MDNNRYSFQIQFLEFDQNSISNIYHNLGNPLRLFYRHFSLLLVDAYLVEHSFHLEDQFCLSKEVSATICLPLSGEGQFQEDIIRKEETTYS